MIQDLSLQLNALVTDQCLLIRVPRHPTEVLTDTIGDQVGLIAIEWRSVLHRLHLAWNGHEELLWGQERIGKVRV